MDVDNASPALGQGGRTDAPEGARRPGAYSYPHRPLGARPSWLRPQTISTNINSQTSQSNFPPEMRTVLPSPVPAELAQAPDPAPSAQERQNALPMSNVNSSPSRRTRRSSLFSNLTYAGDAHVSTTEEEDEKKFRKETWAVVCFIIVLIAVAVGVGVAVASPDCKDCDTPAPTEARATEAPTSKSSESPRLVLLRDALIHLSPDPSVLQDPTTPQYDALVWMADEDEAAIDVDDTRRLEVRYALAALYYATNGDNWFQNLGFLSPQHECKWFVELELDDNTTSVDGVLCDEEDEVVFINLGTSRILVLSRPKECMIMLPKIASNYYCRCSQTETAWLGHYHRNRKYCLASAR
jgi:hypothetical protein